MLRRQLPAALARAPARGSLLSAALTPLQVGLLHNGSPPAWTLHGVLMVSSYLLLLQAGQGMPPRHEHSCTASCQQEKQYATQPLPICQRGVCCQCCPPLQWAPVTWST